MELGAFVGVVAVGEKPVQNSGQAESGRTNTLGLLVVKSNCRMGNQRARKPCCGKFMKFRLKNKEQGTAEHGADLGQLEIIGPINISGSPSPESRLPPSVRNPQ